MMMCEVHSPLTAFALLVGAFFIFDLSYPAEAGATLECIQRVLMGINPSNGTKVGKAKGHKIRSGVHESVLALVKEMAVFELTV